MRRALLVALCAALLLASGGCGVAGEATKYPTKPIDLIGPWAPGGGSDAAARMMAWYATKKFGQTVNVVNIAGASNVTGMLQALTSAPDGYTLMSEAAALSSFMFATRTDLPLKLEDRTIMVNFAADYVYYLTNNTTGWKTLDDALRALRSRPEEFTWGAGAYGSTPMFGQMILFTAAGIDVGTIKKTKMVVFEKGNAPSLQALASGDVQFALALPTELDAMLATGRVRVLATTSPERNKDFPDFPTTKELGYPNATMALWSGVSGPKGVPDHVVKAWDDLARAAVADPEAQAEAAKLKKTWKYMGPAEFKAYILKEHEEAKIVAAAMGLQR